MRIILIAAILALVAVTAEAAPIVTNPDGSLRLISQAPVTEVDVVTRNLAPASARRTSIPALAKAGPWAAAAAAVADEYTTSQGLSRGCKEVGLIKSTAGRIIVKVLLVWALWALVEFADGTTGWVQTDAIPWIAAAIWGGVAYHNSRVRC